MFGNSSKHGSKLDKGGTDSCWDSRQPTHPNYQRMSVSNQNAFVYSSSLRTGVNTYPVMAGYRIYVKDFNVVEGTVIL